MSTPEHNGTNGQGPALKLNMDADALWELVGGVHYTKIGDHDNQSAARLAARLAGVHPTASEEILHQVDCKLRSVRRRLALEKQAEEEIKAHTVLMKMLHHRA